MTSLRAPILAANWKMNKGPADARSFFARFRERVPPAVDRTLVFFPPAVSLSACVQAVAGRDDLLLGVQNLHWERSGAFTGEFAAEMAAEAGARVALVGHSERRHLFGETDDEVARKTVASLRAGLVPIVCVGETLAERKADRLEEVLARQLGAVLGAIGDTEAAFGLAYEPVWAIGTGVNATPADASAAHSFLRRRLVERAARFSGVPILYGGSVKPANAGELLRADEVGGLLVGGASLDPSEFTAIVAAAD